MNAELMRKGSRIFSSEGLFQTSRQVIVYSHGPFSREANADAIEAYCPASARQRLAAKRPDVRQARNIKENNHVGAPVRA